MKRIIMLAVLALAADAAGAADLAINGQFDSTLSSWQQAGDPLPIWSPLDVAGAPNSGSGQGASSSMVAADRVFVLTQCIDNLEPARYFIAASGRAASGQAGGRIGVSINGFAVGACAGGGQFASGSYFTPLDLWQRVAFKGGAGNAGNGNLGSIWVRLFVEKTDAGGTLVGNFDDVVVDRILLEEGFE